PPERLFQEPGSRCFHIRTGSVPELHKLPDCPEMGRSRVRQKNPKTGKTAPLPDNSQDNLPPSVRHDPFGAGPPAFAMGSYFPNGQNVPRADCFQSPKYQSSPFCTQLFSTPKEKFPLRPPLKNPSQNPLYHGGTCTGH